MRERGYDWSVEWKYDTYVRICQRVNYVPRPSTAICRNGTPWWYYAFVRDLTFRVRVRNWIPLQR